MELSSDNIEELAKVLTSDTSHQNDVFQLKPADLSTLDVDRVISDTQDSLLKTSLEAIRSCDVPCSFNDILDDICKMNNNIELQQAAVANPMPTETPTYYHMPDLEMQPHHDYSAECNFSNQTDFLQPLGGQWSEFLPLPPAALSTIQDIPHLAPIPVDKPVTPIPEPVPIPVSIKELPQEEIPTIMPNTFTEEKQLDPAAPVSIAIAPPMQYFNNYQYTIPPMQPIEMQNANIQFAQCPDGNINFMVLPEQPIIQSSMAAPAFGGAQISPAVVPQQQGPPFFDWARVVPRRAFIQPSEIVVLRPLRTRKVMSSRATFDLASYFDTSSISIPMIRERPRPRAHRRKQKLYTIPGADNLVFEVQLGSDKEDNNNNNDNDDQLYPETDIPELDEIFKRKRRSLNPKRNPLPPVDLKGPSLPSPVEAEEEKNEAAIETKNLESTPSPIQELQESYSDIDSEDEQLTAVKSMKCQNCRKLFKTYRSLTIHSKRCKVVRPISPKTTEEQDNVIVPTEVVKPPRATRKVSTPPVTVSTIASTPKDNADTKKPGTVGRPLTRSQTRNAVKRKQSVAEDDDDVVAQKMPK